MRAPLTALWRAYRYLLADVAMGVAVLLQPNAGFDQDFHAQVALLNARLAGMDGAARHADEADLQMQALRARHGAPARRRR